MPGDWKQALEVRLADVPKGELLVCAKSDTLFFSPPACACIGQDDKGRLDIWPLYPGVELTLQAYSAKFVAFHHDVSGRAAAGNQPLLCRARGLHQRHRPGAVSRRGDLSLHGLHTCVETVMQFPFDGYLGFSFRIDTAQLDANPPEFMRDAGVTGAQILTRLLRRKRLFRVLLGGAGRRAARPALHSAGAAADSLCQAQVSGAVLLLSVTNAPPATPERL